MKGFIFSICDTFCLNLEVFNIGLKFWVKVESHKIMSFIWQLRFMTKMIKHLANWTAVERKLIRKVLSANLGFIRFFCVFYWRHNDSLKVIYKLFTRVQHPRAHKRSLLTKYFLHEWKAESFHVCISLYSVSTISWTSLIVK